MALDYGQKRAGLAVTDENRIIATGLETVPTAELMNFLKEYLRKETVDLLLIGKPMRMHYEESQIEPQIKAFIARLKKEIPTLPVERYDERFTSKMAFQTMIDAGLKKQARQNKALVDKISATIILQSYMEYLSNKI